MIQGSGNTVNCSLEVFSRVISFPSHNLNFETTVQADTSVVLAIQKYKILKQAIKLKQPLCSMVYLKHNEAAQQRRL